MVESKEPKVLLGCPVYDGKDYIIDRYIERIKELTYPNYDILLVDNSKTVDFAKKIKKLGVNVIKLKWQDNSKKRVVSARNYIRDYALKNNYDYFFSLECDLIAPKDIIEQLLSCKKEIVCGWYYICPHPYIRPCLSREWTMVGGKFQHVLPLPEYMAKHKLMKCWLGSFGCILIHRSVLEKIKFKTYNIFSHHDDTWFFFDCEKLGFEVWCKTDLLVPHFQKDTWSDTKKKNWNSDFDKMRAREEEYEIEEINI